MMVEIQPPSCGSASYNSTVKLNEQIWNIMLCLCLAGCLRSFDRAVGTCHTNKKGRSLLRSSNGHRISLCGKIHRVKLTTMYIRNGINFLLGKKLKIGNAPTEHDAWLLAWWAGQVFPVTMSYISFNGSHSHNWESYKQIWRQADGWLDSMDQCDNKTRTPKKLNQPAE